MSETTMVSFYLGYMTDLISETVQSQLVRLGFTFVYECPDGIPNFKVIPPVSWMIQQGFTDDLLLIYDVQNRCRASFDFRPGGRVRVLRRFVVEVNHGIGYSSNVRDRMGESLIHGQDGYMFEDDAEADIEPWLDEHHPEWRDPLAYWD